MSDVKFVYARNENGFPVGCFAFTLECDDNDTTVKYGYSIHFVGDDCNKERARNIAAQRLAGAPETFKCVGKRGRTEMMRNMLIHATTHRYHAWAKVLGASSPARYVLKDGTEYSKRRLGSRFSEACALTVNHLGKVLKKTHEAA